MTILYEFDPELAFEQLTAVQNSELSETISTDLITIPSPCIGVCKMDGDLCAGCYRTLDELREWSKAGPLRKIHIWREVKQRMFEV